MKNTDVFRQAFQIDRYYEQMTNPRKPKTKQLLYLVVYIDTSIDQAQTCYSEDGSLKFPKWLAVSII